MDDMSLDLVSLQQAYGNGASPEDVVRLVYRRIRAANDPGIFISLLDEEAAVARARTLGRKSLFGARLSPSRTISTSRICRRLPPARTSPTSRMRTLSALRD